MSKLLYIITRSEQGGAQVHLMELLKGYNARFDLHLATGERGFLVEEAEKLGIKVIVLENLVHRPHPVKDLRGVKEIRTLLREMEPDMLHLHSSKAGLLGRLAARLEKVPAVFTAHGWAFTDGSSWKRKAIAIPSEALTARMGGHIITVSKYDYELAMRYRVARPEWMTVIHNGIADVRRRASPGKNDVPRIVMVARFAPPKDHAILLRALSHLKDLQWELDMVGDGPLAGSSMRLAEGLGLNNRVRFMGARKDVAEIMASGHLFVLASNYEGFPVSIIEAMRAGLPVVASNVGGVSEAVIDGATGFLVSRGDVEGLSDRLERLLRNPALRVQMGAKGRKRYEMHFTAEQMLKKTMEVYERLLK